ncbi:hypothetical protein BLNAU_22422 [Blattamonas nauphoetae]|uniref:Uncharacterized protein n=1 Tax=Blattamonas nauphoetae TaxID=2049346 RepID=A0ABQ9WT49_9EUKA|nr:hypothetical protein BLNAU_22422 [Blattamonas nauphoetae]
MTTLSSTESPSPDSPCPGISSESLSSSLGCSPFLNWNEEPLESESEQAVVFWSLVATVQLQPSLDDSLEAKAVKFLNSEKLYGSESAADFLSMFGQTTGESSTHFIHSIVVLVSLPSQVITTAAMEMLNNLVRNCSPEVTLALVKADMIPQLINTLNPLSLSFTEGVDIHTCLLLSIITSVHLATPFGLETLGIEDDDEQQAVHETIMKQVLAPSEKYIRHLCVNRYSNTHENLSKSFMALLARHLRICPYYQPAMDFVLHIPVILTIPSCLTFYETENSIWAFLFFVIEAQRERNKQGGKTRQMWKKVEQMFRMEGIEDVIEEKLLNDQNEYFGECIVINSIKWNNLLGMNIPEHE